MTQENANESAIRGLINTFVDGWNAADGIRLASAFTADADFTAITGLHARGRDLIACGHDEIFSTVYRGTKNSGKIESIHYLRPDVALINAKFTVRNEDGTLPFGVPFSSAGIIATKDDGVWAIAVFRNMIPFGRSVAGPLEQRQQRAS